MSATGRAFDRFELCFHVPRKDGSLPSCGLEGGGGDGGPGSVIVSEAMMVTAVAGA